MSTSTAGRLTMDELTEFIKAWTDEEEAIARSPVTPGRAVYETVHRSYSVDEDWSPPSWAALADEERADWEGAARAGIAAATVADWSKSWNAVAEADEQLVAWAVQYRMRDKVILAALDGGVSKHRVHVLTGIARTTIDRIASANKGLAREDDHVTRLTVEEADRLAQERPPYPPPSDVPAEQCPGPTKWHRPLAEDWNQGNRESACTWCRVPIGRNFADPVWRAVTPAVP